MVAREGSAPPISGCRPDVMLFHHRAENGCRGWTRTTSLAFKGRCPAIRRPGTRGNGVMEWWSIGLMGTDPAPDSGNTPTIHYSIAPIRRWWPARVTLPVQRIKSPLHHFNAGRPKWCSRQDSHLHWRRSRRRVSAVGLRERNGWSLLPVPLRHDFLTKEAYGLLRGG
jgi:hypothetical protein